MTPRVVRVPAKAASTTNVSTRMNPAMPSPSNRIGKALAPVMLPTYRLVWKIPYVEGQGLRLFSSRAIQALCPGSGRQGFISFAHRDPEEMLSVCGQFVQMGLSITEMVPGFNRYEGAQLLAGTSQMLRVTTTSKPTPAWERECTAPIYTAQVARALGGVTS